MDRAIDVDALWRVATRRTEASPTPPANLEVEGLRRLVSALQIPGRYGQDALRIIQREIFVWIQSYLAFQGDLARHPEIRDVPVTRPLFITGFGRTGSTLLLNLLALDPAARAPLLWELLAPSPPPRYSDRAGDPRIALAQRRVEIFSRIDPSMQDIHPMAADAPDECHWMMRHSPLTVTLYRVPEYWAWLKGLSKDDLRRLYEGYRLQVQHLQLFARRTHWLSKSFSHLHYMPVLRNVFPDARVVRLHRHPAQAVPSLCSLVAIYRRLTAPEIDRAEIGATLLDMFIDGTDRLIAAAEQEDAGRAIDISYDELTADPVEAPLAVVRRLYAQFGYPWTAAFEGAIVRYLEAQRRDRPRHAYALEQFGLSRPNLLHRCQSYLDWAEARCGPLRR